MEFLDCAIWVSRGGLELQILLHHSVDGLLVRHHPKRGHIDPPGNLKLLFFLVFTQSLDNMGKQARFLLFADQVLTLHLSAAEHIVNRMLYRPL